MGCKKISPGCKNCYAEKLAERFRGVKNHPFENGFDISVKPEKLDAPLLWKKSKMIFVNSMSDLFLDEIPDVYIDRVFNVMTRANQHTFQVLTKRPNRMLEWTKNRFNKKVKRGEKLVFPKNIWLGVSVENKQFMKRIKLLKETPATIKFISFEPLLGNVKCSSYELQGISWVIVGGESGNRARPMKPDWVRTIQLSCIEANVPFFFKQWGTYNNKGIKTGKEKAGRNFEGKTWNEMPVLT